jgi:hypothetical protein
MNQLEPCPQCNRHVNISETSCPFCAHSLAEAFANIEPRVFPRARLGRAATLAFGVLAMSQGACEGGKSPPDSGMANDGGPRDAGPNDGGPPDVFDDDGGTPIYASAPTPTKDAGAATSKG